MCPHLNEESRKNFFRATSRELCRTASRATSACADFTARLLARDGSPVAIHRSKSRWICAGGVEDDETGGRKLRIRLTVQESKETLTSLCGNGRLKGLRLCLFTDLLRILQLEHSPEKVQIQDIRSTSKDRTVIEITIEPSGISWACDVKNIGCRMTEQVQTNRNSMTSTHEDQSLLSSLILHFEADEVVTGTSKTRRSWSLIVMIVLVFASGCAAWSGGLPLATQLPLRQSTNSLVNVPVTPQPSAGKLPLDGGLLRRTHRSSGPRMLEPLSAAVYGAAILSSMASKESHLTKLLAPEALVPIGMTGVASAVAVFRQQDVNENGELDLRELTAALKALGMFESEAVALRLFHEADADSSGSLDLEEFQQLISRPLGPDESRLSDSLSDTLSKASRSSKTLIRATRTLTRSVVKEVAEKRFLEEEYPAESGLIQDLLDDVMSSVVDLGDEALCNAERLLSSKTQLAPLLDWLMHKSQLMAAASHVHDFSGAVPVLTTIGIVAPFLPIAYSMLASAKDT